MAYTRGTLPLLLSEYRSLLGGEFACSGMSFVQAVERFIEHNACSSLSPLAGMPHIFQGQPLGTREMFQVLPYLVLL